MSLCMKSNKGYLVKYNLAYVTLQHRSEGPACSCQIDTPHQLKLWAMNVSPGHAHDRPASMKWCDASVKVMAMVKLLMLIQCRTSRSIISCCFLNGRSSLSCIVAIRRIFLEKSLSVILMLSAEAA